MREKHVCMAYDFSAKFRKCKFYANSRGAFVIPRTFRHSMFKENNVEFK